MMSKRAAGKRDMMARGVVKSLGPFAPGPVTSQQKLFREFPKDFFWEATMGVHERFDEGGVDDLPTQFVDKFVAMWARHGQPADDLASAMLVGAINMLLAEMQSRDVSLLLYGLAHQISPTDCAGHA